MNDDDPELTPRPRCADCGRYLARAYPVLGYSNAGYASGPYLDYVAGTCKKHGPNVKASQGWWNNLDAWEWEGIEL